MKIFIAIETIPSQAAHLREKIASEFPCVRPPDTEKFSQEEKRNIETGEKPRTFVQLKDAVMIKYHQKCQKREALIESAWRQTAYDGTQGEIICISWAIENHEPNTVSRGLDFEEAELLDYFFTTIQQQRDKQEITWMGYDVISLLQFLFQRAVILRVKPPFRLWVDSSDGREKMYDLMRMWAGFKSKIRFNRLCDALSIPLGEPYIDPSLIWDFVKLGQIQHVVNHCKNQVIRCRKVYQRLCFIDPTLPDAILCSQD